MAAYTGINLIIVHGRINSANTPGASGAVMRVGFLVTVLYATIAGLVAGWTASVADRRSAAEGRA
jgi:hypothetical protein